jgi:hypothetical protein
VRTPGVGFSPFPSHDHTAATALSLIRLHFPYTNPLSTAPSHRRCWREDILSNDLV